MLATLSCFDFMTYSIRCIARVARATELIKRVVGAEGAEIGVVLLIGVCNGPPESFIEGRARGLLELKTAML